MNAFGSYVLKRGIPGSGCADATGTYPLCPLSRDADIVAGCAALRAAGLVSVVLVADAFFGPQPERLARDFAFARPYKTHYVHDRSRAFRYTSHHRYELKRAHAECTVREVQLAEYLADWKRLYDHLIQRHGVTGLQRFSESYFDALARLPDIHAHAAFHDEGVVAMHLWMEHAGVIYSHLAASNESGYRVRAGYALNDFALDRFRDAQAIDFGSGAGAADDPADGLARFKQGFANRTETFFLCGKVLDAHAYASLCAGREASEYFPAYRA